MTPQLAQGGKAPWRTPLSPVTPMRHSDLDSERQRDQVQLEQLLAPVLPPLVVEATTMLSCRVPAQPHQALKAWCQLQGIPLSDYVRSRLYDQPLPQRQPKRFVSPLDRGVLVELNRLGNNLNQTVRRLHRQDHPRLSDSDRQLLQNTPGAAPRHSDQVSGVTSKWSSLKSTKMVRREPR